jgi:RNA polymerase sigma factor (sigma-70 family)
MALTFAKLVEQHYASLRRIAARAIRNRTHPERMSPTSLVAETVLRLMQQREKPKSEDHLRGLATVFMTRVLADASRTRMAQRRGGGKATRSMQDPTVEIDLSLHARQAGERTPIRSLVDRDELLRAMEEIAHEHPRPMEIVTLHLVADIPLARVATLVGVSERTAYRDLEEGRRALAQRLRGQHG